MIEYSKDVSGNSYLTASDSGMIMSFQSNIGRNGRVVKNLLCCTPSNIDNFYRFVYANFENWMEPNEHELSAYDLEFGLGSGNNLLQMISALHRHKEFVIPPMISSVRPEGVFIRTQVIVEEKITEGLL